MTVGPSLLSERNRMQFIEYRRTSDPRLARALVEANMNLAILLARKLDRTHGRLRGDLVQEAHLGLIEAVRRFDPERGVTFATYATFWIRAYILRFLRDNARLVRVGRSRADRAAYARGEGPPAELSLQAPVRAGERAEALGDQLPDGAPLADTVLEAAEVAARTRAIGGLSARERLLVEHRLLAAEPQPLRRIARRLSLSGERVRQIEQQLLSRLRYNLGDRDASQLAA